LNVNLNIAQSLIEITSTFSFSLKGVFAKNERGYRLNAIKKALLIASNLIMKNQLYTNVAKDNR